MAPDVKRDIRDELEAQLQVIAIQAVNGKQIPTLLKLAADNTAALGKWLNAHKLDMAEGTYDEGRAFLRRIDNALKKVSEGY